MSDELISGGVTVSVPDAEGVMHEMTLTIGEPIATTPNPADIDAPEKMSNREFRELAVKLERLGIRVPESFEDMKSSKVLSDLKQAAAKTAAQVRAYHEQQSEELGGESCS